MKIKNLLLAFACGAFLFSSCSDDGNIIINDDQEALNVPQNVKDEFHKLYKNAKDVKWENVSNYHVARFNGSISRGNDAYSSSAWFTKEGKHCQSEQEIAFDQLPAMVQEGFTMYKEVKYPNWTIDECEIVDRVGMGVIFVIEIEKGDKEREISLSEYGDILKDVSGDDDDDFEDILPIIIPEDLEEALKLLFPEHFDSVSIVEIDFENNEITVDVLVGTEHREIKFDSHFQWISTEYEAKMKEFLEMLGQEFEETRDHLIALAEKYKVDIFDPLVQKHIEIEVEEHYQRGKTYSIEIKLGKLEIEFRIDRFGKIIIEEDD